MLEIILTPFTALGLVWALLFAVGWAHRTQRKRTERLINALFRDEHHCAKVYLAEMTQQHLPKEYHS